MLNEILRVARKEEGLNQDEVAKALGVHKRTLGNWEDDDPENRTIPNARDFMLLLLLYKKSTAKILTAYAEILGKEMPPELLGVVETYRSKVEAIRATPSHGSVDNEKAKEMGMTREDIQALLERNRIRREQLEIEKEDVELRKKLSELTGQ